MNLINDDLKNQKYQDSMAEKSTNFDILHYRQVTSTVFQREVTSFYRNFKLINIRDTIENRNEQLTRCTGPYQKIG